MIQKLHLKPFIYILFFLFSLFSNENKEIEKNNQLINETLRLFQKELLTQEINHLFDDNQFNGEISVKKDRLIMYQKSEGYEDFYSKTKLDSNSIFAIGSISKQFTVCLVLLEEEKGHLKTEDKVAKYLSQFKNKQYENITIHQLLNHTSRINNFGNGLLFKSGSDFNYSNKGYLFLGKLLEKSFDELARKLFKKVNLKNTFTSATFKNNDFASAYIRNKKNAHKVQNMPNRLAKKFISVPAGGLLSNVNDLHLWNSALYNEKILSAKSLQKLTTSSIQREHFLFGNVGYGIMTNSYPPTACFHTGYVKFTIQRQKHQ